MAQTNNIFSKKHPNYRLSKEKAKEIRINHPGLYSSKTRATRSDKGKSRKKWWA